MSEPAVRKPSEGFCIDGTPIWLLWPMCDVAAGPHGRSDERRSTIDERASDGRASDERAGGTSWGGRAGGRASELSSSDARAVAAGCGSCSLWRLAAIVPPFDLRPDSACAHTRARGKAREQAKCGGYQGCVMRWRMEQTAGRPPGSANACTAQRERLRTTRGDRGRSVVPLARRDPRLLHAWVRHGESLACSRASRPPGLQASTSREVSRELLKGWRPGGLEARRGFKSSAEVKCVHINGFGS